ncbi:MAG: O-antigen ligase family protein [Candidatus Hydrogenedentota bacterium]
MNKDRLSQVSKSLIILWFLSIPLSITLADTLFTILIFLSLFKIKSSGFLKNYWPTWLFLSVIIIISLFAPDSLLALKRSKRFLSFLIIIPISIFDFSINDFKKLSLMFLVEILVLEIISIVFKNYDQSSRLYMAIHPLHPGLFGSLMGFAILNVLSKNVKYLKLLVIVILLFGIYKTQSRITFILLVFLLPYILYKNKLNYKIISGILVLMIFFIIMILISRYKLYINTIDDPSLKMRFILWKMGLMMFLDNWLWGVGPGHIESVYNKYAFDWLKTSLWDDLHSDYIQILVEYGIIGFLSYISYIFFTLKCSYKLSCNYFLLLIFILLCGCFQLMLFSSLFNRIIAFVSGVIIYCSSD